MVEWLNEPPAWEVRGETLLVTAGPRTDFWRTTHYGFVRDTGHCWFRPWDGDFVATVTVRGAYRERYDQAGLMVRLDDRVWLKCGVEFVDGRQYASAVVTASVVISAPGETGVASWAPMLPSARGLTLRRSPTISAGIMNRRMSNLLVFQAATGVAVANRHHRISVREVLTIWNAGECGLPGAHHQIPVPRERWRWTLIVWAGTSFRKRPTVLTVTTDSGSQRPARSDPPTAERLLSHCVPVHEPWHSSREPTRDVMLRTGKGKGARWSG